MHTTETILTLLQSRRSRITPLRQALVALFCRASSPLSLSEIMVALGQAGLTPNKTTIYRELDFFQAQEVISELDFGEGKKRYELSAEHHHHLVCTSCEVIQEVSLDAHLHDQETKIERETGFKITRHMLEFFGVCGPCRKRKEVL